MEKYHKIQSIYKRDQKGNMLFGHYSTPEIEYLSGLNWDATEKLDGTNIRVDYDVELEKVTFGGRTDNAQLPVVLWEKLSDMFWAKKFKDANMPSLTLYGEGHGVGMRKIKKDADFTMFDVFCGGLWLQQGDVEDIAKQLGVVVVPRVFRCTLNEAEKYVETGFESEIMNGVQAEGLVLRPCVELQDRRANRIIVKIKTKDFKNKEQAND